MSTPIFTQIVMEGDSARTRQTDPVKSHRAADKSQKAIHQTKRAVLRLIHDNEQLSGQEVCDLYSILSGLPGWPTAKTETPRKRAGELFEDGFLADVSDEHDDGRVYELTAQGRAAIGVDA